MFLSQLELVIIVKMNIYSRNSKVFITTNSGHETHTLI